MIQKAKENSPDQFLSFHNCSAEQLDYQNEFENIFCNSAFQWFIDSKKVLKACNIALKQNGKIAIQAPATDNYCPIFVKAIEDVKRHKSTRYTFETFSSPGLFLNTAEDYSELFEEAGFRIEKSSIDKAVTYHSAEETYKIFESGAAAG